MNLTKYVVELAISGIATVTWVVLILITLVDINWSEVLQVLQWATPFDIMTSLFLILGPFIYVIGIVNDRLIDNVFDALFEKDIMKTSFKSKEAYQKAVANICINSEALMSRFNYSRMRIRICRAWAFNSSLILVALNLFLWFRLGNIDGISSFANVQEKIPVLSLFFSGLFIISTITSFYAWKKLAIKECANLKVQNDMLNRMAAPAPKSQVVE